MGVGSRRSKGVYDGLPSKIKVGPYTIKIAIMPGEWFEETHHYGEFSEVDQRIRLCEIQPSLSFARDVLIHEICHAIYGSAHMEPGDSEERVCSTFATSLAQLLFDNPKLVKWLTSNLRRRG